MLWFVINDQGWILSVTLWVQLLKYSDSEKHARHQQQGSHILNMDNFIDTTNIEGRFEFSEYVRGYGKYLDEQLEVYARINFYMVGSSYKRCAP